MSDVECRVGLFVTCLVDLFRPTIGFATVKLLEDAGCTVVVPAAQTCCGQPAFNAGDRKDTRAIARQVIAAFEDFDYVVAPSGSCAGMLKLHYPGLFENEPAWEKRAKAMAGKVHEIVSFLVDVLKVEPRPVRHTGTATYHDACSGLREMGIHAQPRQLLGAVDGLTMVDLPDANVCCGFGGTFCVKYPEISAKMVSDKTKAIAETGADTLLAGDLGCLLNMAGRLSREGHPVRARHIVEVLADMTDRPAIGEPAVRRAR